MKAEDANAGSDGDRLIRCSWAQSDPESRHYHDTEWGVAVHGEAPLFERITLEAFQSGLSWRTILNKREAFREAFADFDPETVAAFNDRDVERLMNNAAIVRNRAKIQAAITNARAVVALRAQGGLDQLIWSYKSTSIYEPTSGDDLPTKTSESAALARELKTRGFVFVGPTTALALMSAVGLVDLHLVDCHRRGCGPSAQNCLAAGRTSLA